MFDRARECRAIIIISGYRDHDGGFKAEKTPSLDAAALMTHQSVRAAIAKEGEEKLGLAHQLTGKAEIFSSTRNKYLANSSGFSLIGKWPRPFMMVTSQPKMLSATPSVSSGVQE